MTTQPLCEIEFPESPIPDGCFRRLDEVIIKRDGCVWRIHKNDADPKPSNPQAHNLESGLVLDLCNGDLYFGSKPTGKKISRKNLEFIRAESEKKGVTPPPLAL